MSGDMDDDILSYFPISDDELDEGMDSADEILSMIDNNKENKKSYQSKKNASESFQKCNDEDQDENIDEDDKDQDDEVDEDTKSQIAALQAQIELLKSSKKLSTVNKTRQKKDTVSTVNTNSDMSCRHGKSINQCSFCSKPAQTAKFVKKPEHIKLPEKNNILTKESLPTAVNKINKNKIEDAVLEIDNICKHGKSINQCFFCSKSAQTPTKIVEKPEKMSLPEENNILAKESVQMGQAYTNDSEKCGLLPQKKRLAHETTKVNKENDRPKKRVKVDKEQSKDVSINANYYKDNVSGENTLLFGGIDVSNPVVSSIVFDEKMKGRKLIKISKIESSIKDKDVEGDWVTIGVVVRKVTQKKTSNGKNFCVWHLSDLCCGTENNVIGIFLFGQSYEQHWKIQVGRVIALLNPSLMKQDKDSGQQQAITIDNPKKLMELGYSRQLSGCKGIRKSDGKMCTMYINKKYGDYCEYHVQAAFKKAKSGRMDLQSGGRTPRNKGKMLKNLKKDITEGVYYYGGKTVTLHEEKGRGSIQSKGKNNGGNTGLKSVMGSTILDRAAKDFIEIKLIREQQAKAAQAQKGVNTLPKDAITAKSFLKQNRNELLNLSKNENKADIAKEKKDVTKNFSDINFFNNTDSSGGKNKISPKIKTNSKNYPKLGNPVLGRGLNSKDHLEFSFEEEEDCLSYNKYTGEELPSSDPVLNHVKKPSSILAKQNNTNEKCKSVENIQAKRNAVNIIQANGPIEFVDPNEITRKKKSPKSIKGIEEKIEKSEGTKLSKDTNQIIQRKKSMLAGVLGQIDLKSDDGKKLLQQKSKHVGAVRLAESEKEEKYFDSLEKKECMLEKMANTYEIKVSGIACRECQYLAESQSGLCKDLKHNVAKISNVVKRFFMCKSCKQRCCSYNKLIPKKACTRCGENNFEKVSMAVQRKGPLIGGETLEIRGKEQKFINSCY